MDPPGSRDSSRWEEYNRENLPIRDDNTFRRDATHIEETQHGEAIEETGIAGLAILSQLPSIDFPRSFPPDGMHLFFENVIPALVRHYRGVFFKKDFTTERAAGGTNNTQGKQGRQAGSGRHSRTTLNRSPAVPRATSKPDNGQVQRDASSSAQLMQKQKFRKTPDPWNVGPKVWEQIRRDQKVCDYISTTTPAGGGEKVASYTSVAAIT